MNRLRRWTFRFRRKSSICSARCSGERHLSYLIVSHDLAVTAHLCSEILVMHHGRYVETLTDECIRNDRAEDDYTRQLLAASKGFDRDFIAGIKDF